MKDNFVKPADALTFDPAKFRTILDYAMESVRSRNPLHEPTNYGISLVGDGGDVTRLTLTDIIENRFAMAVKHHCGNASGKFQSFMYRWFALHELLHSGVLKSPWYRRTEQFDFIDDRAIALAASFPIESHGGFDGPKFVAALEKML